MDPLPGDDLGHSRYLTRDEPRRARRDARRAAEPRDITTGRPATQDTTSYRCASITKTMTATLVMQQVEAGRMRLDAPITTYVSWTRRVPDAREISIRHLLIHGGGVIRDGSNSWGDDDFPDRDAVRRELRQRLTFAEPSTTFRYSNMAYVLLGDALEAVSGKAVRGAAATQRSGCARHAGECTVAHAACPQDPRHRVLPSPARRGTSPCASRRGARVYPGGRPGVDGSRPAHLSARAFSRRGRPHLRPVTSRDAADTMAAPRGAESRLGLDDLARRRGHDPRAQWRLPGVHHQDRLLAGVGSRRRGPQQHEQRRAGDGA